jgi:hypothetical protein
MSSGAMSHEITPIRGLQVAKSFLVNFCDETKSIGPLGFNQFHRYVVSPLACLIGSYYHYSQPF